MSEDGYHIPDPLVRDDVGVLKHFQMNFTDILSGDIMYIMPRFQRQYTWDLTNFKSLWADIDAIWRNDEPKQFLGPIITRNHTARTGREAGRTWVVDGQQRITTLYALNVALGKVAQDSGFEDIAQGVTDLLFITRYDDKNKPLVCPTVKDLKQFNDILRDLLPTKQNMSLEDDYGDLTLMKNGYKKYGCSKLRWDRW